MSARKLQQNFHHPFKKPNVYTSAPAYKQQYQYTGI